MTQTKQSLQSDRRSKPNTVQQQISSPHYSCGHLIAPNTDMPKL